MNYGFNFVHVFTITSYNFIVLWSLYSLKCLSFGCYQEGPSVRLEFQISKCWRVRVPAFVQELISGEGH